MSPANRSLLSPIAATAARTIYSELAKTSLKTVFCAAESSFRKNNLNDHYLQQGA